MKKKIIIVFIVLTVLCVVFAASASAAPSVFSVMTDIGEICPEGRVIYLPSCVNIKSVRFSFKFPSPVVRDYSGNVITGGLGFDISSAKTVDEKGIECYKITVEMPGSQSDFTIYHDTNLPTMSITTTKGLSWVESGKENRDKSASVTLISSDGKVEYADTEGGCEIKGRGNATWGYYKKPYQIKLSSKADLLGMGKAKTWILLANYVDQSQLHNALSFEFGELLGVPYNIDYEFVNLYIDGSYCGIYMLCEKVQIDSKRIDIEDLEKATEKANPSVDDLGSLGNVLVTSGEVIRSTILSSYTYTNGVESPDDITGGYLVELDNVWGSNEPSRFTTENGLTYVVKSPEFVSREEMEYIASLFADMEEAIFSPDGYNGKGKHYTEYIDIDSFASVYAVQEMMKNWDAYNSSMFFFKDADKDGVTSKIFMGPLWDLDNALGNINFETYASDTGFLWAQKGEFSGYPRYLARELMKHDDFAAEVKEDIKTLYGAISDYLSPGGFIEKIHEKIGMSVLMDRARWNIDRADRWVMGSGGQYKVSTRFVHFESYGSPFDDEPTTALGYLRYYLRERSAALLKALAPDDDPNQPPATTETTVTETTTATETTSATTGATVTETTTATETTSATTATETTTVTETTTETETVTTTETTTDSTETTQSADGGCGSAIGAGTGVMCVALLLGVCLTTKKRK